MLGFHSRIYSYRDETYVFRRDLSDDQIRIALETISAQRDKQNVDYVCEKSPSHIRKCNDIFRLYPDAKFVAIVREPRDVVASFKRRGVPVDRSIRNWLLAYRSLLRWQAQGLPVFAIQFESLIKNPTKTLHEICGYLGLSYESTMLDYWTDPRPWQKVSEIRRPETVTGSDHVIYRNWQIHQPLMTDRVGTYHSDLSYPELRLIHEKLASVSSKFGYRLSEPAESKVSLGL